MPNPFMHASITKLWTHITFTPPPFSHQGGEIAFSLIFKARDGSKKLLLPERTYDSHLDGGAMVRALAN